MSTVRHYFHFAFALPPFARARALHKPWVYTTDIHVVKFRESRPEDEEEERNKNKKKKKKKGKHKKKKAPPVEDVFVEVVSLPVST